MLAHALVAPEYERVRIKPTALVGIGVWLLYVVIIVIVGQFGGVPYTELGDSASNIMRGVVPSLVLGALVIAGLSVWMGWFGVAMRDQHRIKVWWALIPAAISLVTIGGNFAFTDWGNVEISFLLAVLALGIAVGFAEEFVCRGMLLVGLRGSFREVVAWALSCVIFGLMHTVNIFLGAPPSGTVGQIISAGMGGSIYYLLRRYYGSLIPAMIMHGLYDISVFTLDHSDGPGSILSLLDWPAGIIAVILGLLVALRTDKGQQESYARGGSSPVPATA